MKKFLISLIMLSFVAMFSAPAKAQIIDSIFMNLPEKISPLLNKQMKFEILEYFKAGQIDSVKNKLQGKSVMISRDTMQQSMVLSTTNANDLQIKLFNSLENSYIVGIIETIYNPIISSKISFYDAKWKLLDFDFEHPRISDWLDIESLSLASLDPSWLKKVDEHSYLGMRFLNNTPALKVTNHSLEILNKEDKVLMQSLLKSDSKNEMTMIFKIDITNNKIKIKN